MESISSLQNPRIKQIVQLSKSRERKEQGLIVVEGAREIGLALNAGYIPEVLYVCHSIYQKSEYPTLLDRIPDQNKIEITETIFHKVAYREGSDGLIGLFKSKPNGLNDLKINSDKPFIIVLEAVEKPGNLGAILRTADAAKADAVIICDPTTDLFNPNVIRSSVGCIFTVPVAICDSESCRNWLQKNAIKSFAAELSATKWYYECNFSSATAVVMGTEADGLTPFWLDNANERIKIPMRGMIDSLNVSVSTAILTYEALRQRSI
jgi:RNA methyltransferase, TrmH family